MSQRLGFKRAVSVLLVFSLVFTMFSWYGQLKGVSAQSLEEQLDEIEQELAEIAKQKQDVQGIIDSYNSEAASYSEQLNYYSARISLIDTEIAEKKIQIEQLELSIEILEEEIEVSTSVISQTEFDADFMQERVLERIMVMYVDYKTGIGTTEIDASIETEDVFKKLQYKNVLIAQTQELINDFNQKLVDLEVEKTELERKKLELEADKEQVDEEKANLDSKRAELSQERQKFYNLQYQAYLNGQAASGEYNVLDDQESKARAQAELIKQQLFGSTGSIPNGSFVVAGTIIGYQGTTGISTGPHLHFVTRQNGQSVNPCSVLGGGPFGNCSGNGSMPYWPIQGTHYFTSGYGDRCYSHNGSQRCNFHDGIDLAHPTASAPVYAAHDGWMYQGFDPCGWSSLCNGGGANYVIICENKDNCNEGNKSGYWHLSSFN